MGPPARRDFGIPDRRRSSSPRAAVPLLRDPWAACLLVVWAVVCAKSLGGPAGEPVAEDFDCLRRSLLEPWSLWDGGGSKLFWRPVAQQLYFGLIGHSAIAHPGWVAALHIGVLGLVALLVYRALRDAWPKPWAVAAASFPLITDGARTLLLWPSNFADLGVIFFTALCLHETCRRRMPTALGALALALGCKEVALIGGLLLPWVPGAGPRGRKERVRWALAFAGVIAVWAIAYAVVRRASGLQLPIEGPARDLAVGWPERLRWAFVNATRAQLNLPVFVHWTDWLWLGFVGALLVTAAALAIKSHEVRARLQQSAPIALWGALWWTVAAISTAPVHPLWMPYRSVYSGLGLGSALAALLGAAHPALLAAA